MQRTSPQVGSVGKALILVSPKGEAILSRYATNLLFVSAAMAADSDLKGVVLDPSRLAAPSLNVTPFSG